MPGNSRIWIYQSNRTLQENEIKEINKSAEDFIETWTAHNNNLKGSFEIRHALFLIIYIDEGYALASGCSIDKSVHFIQKLEKQYNLSLFERMNVAFRKDDSISIIPVSALISSLRNRELNENNVVFNNLIQTKEELEKNWEIPIGRSWIMEAV